jgi:hypothetical protein
LVTACLALGFVVHPLNVSLGRVAWAGPLSTGLAPVLAKTLWTEGVTLEA